MLIYLYIKNPFSLINTCTLFFTWEDFIVVITLYGERFCVCGKILHYYVGMNVHPKFIVTNPKMAVLSVTTSTLVIK